MAGEWGEKGDNHNVTRGIIIFSVKGGHQEDLKLRFKLDKYDNDNI